MNGYHNAINHNYWIMELNMPQSSETPAITSCLLRKSGRNAGNGAGHEAEDRT